MVTSSALAVRAEILAGIKTEAADVADAAGPAALVFGAVRLGRVLDDDEVVPARDLQIGSMSAGWPYRCTGMMALVRGVIAARCGRVEV